MVCAPVHGDNSQALASGLSPVQVDNHGIAIYTTDIGVDLAHYKILHDIFYIYTILYAKIGKGGINDILSLVHFEDV